jgi:mRNA interferase MazF
MKTGTKPEQGDIVLIPVPFTDLSSQKRRPVIVISSDDYNRRGVDIIVVAMTSNPTAVPFSFRITSADLVEGSLNRPGTVRVDKVYTLAQSIVVKRFAKTSSHIVQRIRQLLDAVTTMTPETNSAVQ